MPVEVVVVTRGPAGAAPARFGPVASGEALLAAAERLLGIPGRPWPLDLSGTPVVFAVDLPYGWDVRPGAGVEKRISTAEVIRAGWVPTGRLRFRRLAPADLPAVLAWQHAPHVAPWLPRWLDRDAMARRYCPRIDGTESVRMHIAELDHRPIGYCQHYLVADHPDYLAAVGDRQAAAIDFVIGEPALVGRGLGPRMIWQYLDELVLPAYPAVPRIVASPTLHNRPAVRALARAGFRTAGPVRLPGQAEPELVCVQDRATIWGI